MIVEGYYLPNTPSIIPVPNRRALGFLPHRRTMAALAEIGRTLPGRVDAAVVLSPHFFARGAVPVLAASAMRQVFDLDGFPAALREVVYEAVCREDLAERIVDGAGKGAIPLVRVTGWGVDHGVWAPLCQVLPGARVPLVVLGVAFGVEDAVYEELGHVIARAAEELRVVVIATGSVYHRLDLWDGQEKPWAAGAEALMNRARLAMAAGDWEFFRGWTDAARRTLAPEGGLQPFRFLAGALGAGARGEILADEAEFGAVSVQTVRFVPSGGPARR